MILSNTIMKMKKNKYLISPNINNDALTKNVRGIDQNNNQVNTKVIQENALTIFLNNQEIVTLMTINDFPEYLAIGYLLNQNMLHEKDEIKKIIYEKEIKNNVNCLHVSRISWRLCNWNKNGGADDRNEFW